MNLLDLTLADAASNLALDEALLEEASSAHQPTEYLRFWESPEPLVVLGRSSRAEEEVDLAECRRQAIPVMRRSSGGAAVVCGPGCLMYAVVLSHELRPELRLIDQAHRFVLERLTRGLQPSCPGIGAEGTSDLAVAGRKVSGNSMRMHRRHLLYHGTLLYDFPLELIGRCLKTAPRQPDYRRGRAHGEFVANLPATADQLRAGLRQVWNPQAAQSQWPQERTEQLAESRYRQASWNLRL